jgi:hypothetical protein
MRGHVLIFIRLTFTSNCDFLRFEVLTSGSRKKAVSWDMTPCNMVNVYDVSEDTAASVMG